MNITIINDCKDANAKNRQITRVSSLFNTSASFVGVDKDIEASGNLVDTLDALGDTEGVILVNIAPRNGKAKQWKNGTPFGYFWYKKVLCVSSIDGLTLSLIKKLHLVSSIKVLDIRESLAESGYDDDIIARAVNSQFRSYDFLPFVAKYIFEHKECAGKELAISDIQDAPPVSWCTDNFGNIKTTLFETDIQHQNQQILINTKEFSFYTQLKDVPNDELALIVGSSGLGDKRFLEIVKQGGRAEDEFGDSDTFLFS